ncbi:hypothetical protein [Mycobacteroides abscessus]|nr:hypothetical protein [Mycobacteroides abscessus]
MSDADKHDADIPEYQVPTWLLGTDPRHPFLIFHDADGAAQ